MVRLATAAYLLALFGLNVFRAAKQSFTTDEAYTYKLYVGAEPFNLLQQYDASLHFLHTLATWASVQLLGLSELTLAQAPAWNLEVRLRQEGWILLQSP